MVTFSVLLPGVKYEIFVEITMSNNQFTADRCMIFVELAMNKFNNNLFLASTKYMIFVKLTVVSSQFAPVKQIADDICRIDGG